MAKQKAAGSASSEEVLTAAILRQIPTPVMAVDKELKIIYLNEAGQKLAGKTADEALGMDCHKLFNSDHCNTAECRMKSVLAGGESCSARNSITIDGKTIPIEYTVDVLEDGNGEVIGGLEYILDITEAVRRENKLREQSRTILEISTPVIKLWDRVLILPIIGVVDSNRAEQMMETMLTRLKETGSKVIILDIQGVAAMDTAVANHLIKIAKATKLMGCTCIISGISPSVAQTLVHLGVNLDTIRTNSDLQEALFDAFSLLDLSITPRR
jgi:rsbT co-antagonist protein RsbR